MSPMFFSNSWRVFDIWPLYEPVPVAGAHPTVRAAYTHHSMTVVRIRTSMYVAYYSSSQFNHIYHHFMHLLPQKLGAPLWFEGFFVNKGIRICTKEKLKKNVVKAMRIRNTAAEII